MAVTQIKVEVAYTEHDVQSLQFVSLWEPAVVSEAIKQSKLLELFPHIDLKINAVGIFGEIVDLNTPIKDGDRIEIYRPLKMDPKEARRLRAKRAS